MFDFIGKKKIFFTISLGFLAVALVCSFVFGVNLDIQFKGGAIMTYSYDGEIAKADFEKIVEDTLGQQVNLQTQTDTVSQKTSYVVSTPDVSGINSDKQLELIDALQKAFPENNVESVSINVVDPVIGKEFLAKCLVSVAFASVLMICYIAFRFKKIGGWSAGVCAVIALFHDLLAVFATFIIFKISIDDNFIAVLLTILGYSLNDTIVIYDRIRENKRLYGNKLTTAELVNKSLNQSLTRSLATTVTTVTAMVVVSVVALVYHVDSILSFSFPLIIGMISGVYSSLCISSCLWVMWQNYKTQKKAA